jgi:SAM-dependent MidA family methyltransferase
MAPRPADLPDRVEWRSEPPADVDGVLLAVEWLDVVPVDVVQLGDDGPRVVEVDARGGERVGAAAAADAVDWLTRWWPLTDVGDRAEVGRPRDEAWAQAVSRLRVGVALAIDYAAVPARDVAGTLTGYQSGRQVMPVPDGSMDLTAHVLFESLVASVPDGVDSLLLSQREALHRLGVRGLRPSYDGDAAAYLAAMSRAGDEAELLDPVGLGGFTWLVHVIGTGNPLAAS